MNILSIGPMNGVSNTCLLRNEALCRIGKVDIVNTRRKDGQVTMYYKIANKLFGGGVEFTFHNKLVKTMKYLD